MNDSIKMVDLKNQYLRIEKDINLAIQSVIDDSQYIKGEKVDEFQKSLASYLNTKYVIGCGNGTDALQIALMALDLKKGDEVIVPAFTYVATAEVIALLGLTPVIVDVDEHTFNLSGDILKTALSEKTKLVVPVHLFGQCADMESILEIAKDNNIKIVEDTAQAIGSIYTFSNGLRKRAGNIGDIGTTSFFPSKNLGCFGDGGALYTDSIELAQKIKTIANHGQTLQYIHDVIGVNSRLDTIQAVVLLEKLKYLDNYNSKRLQVANNYDENFRNIKQIELPFRDSKSTHVFHQYTIKVKSGERDQLREYLSKKRIPSMIYYPMPLHKQKAYQNISRQVGSLRTSEKLCEEVLSLPIHTEMTKDQQSYIIENIKSFFNE